MGCLGYSPNNIQFTASILDKHWLTLSSLPLFSGVNKHTKRVIQTRLEMVRPSSRTSRCSLTQLGILKVKGIIIACAVDTYHCKYFGGKAEDGWKRTHPVLEPDISKLKGVAGASGPPRQMQSCIAAPTTSPVF